MRRRQPVVVPAESTDENARRRARCGWEQGRFGTDQHRPFIEWLWPLGSTGDQFTGVELLERVAADYEAAGIAMPIGGYVGNPYLLPGEIAT